MYSNISLFSKDYKCEVKRRVFQNSAPSTSTSVKREDRIDGPKAKDCPMDCLNSIPILIKKKTSSSWGGDPSDYVYQKFTATLSKIDKQIDKNSYYRLQILKYGEMEDYWLFRSWGRNNTNIGNEKREKMSSCEEAIQKFEKIFYEKTGNQWHERKNFKKIFGKYQLENDSARIS